MTNKTLDEEEDQALSEMVDFESKYKIALKRLSKSRIRRMKEKNILYKQNTTIERDAINAKIESLVNCSNVMKKNIENNMERHYLKQFSFEFKLAMTEIDMGLKLVNKLKLVDDKYNLLVMDALDDLYITLTKIDEISEYFNMKTIMDTSSKYNYGLKYEKYENNNQVIDSKEDNNYFIYQVVKTLGPFNNVY